MSENSVLLKTQVDRTLLLKDLRTVLTMLNRSKRFPNVGFQSSRLRRSTGGSARSLFWTLRDPLPDLLASLGTSQFPDFFGSGAPRFIGFKRTYKALIFWSFFKASYMQMSFRRTLSPLSKSCGSVPDLRRRKDWEDPGGPAASAKIRT
jgi:hypothetical protein